jgi:transcription elongation factor Elf1
MSKKGIDTSRSKSYTTKVKIGDLEKIKNRPDVPNEVKLKDREGVFVHHYKCRYCNLEFKIYSWLEFKHNEDNVYCPECGKKGGKLHFQETINESKEFNPFDGKKEIYGHVYFSPRMVSDIEEEEDE